MKILEVGGASGANFKYFTVPAEIDIVGKHTRTRIALHYDYWLTGMALYYD